MFGDKKEEKDKRFYVKSVDNVSSLGTMTILVDRHTGVNYLHSWVGTGSGMTPLLDQNGNVVIDEIKN